MLERAPIYEALNQYAQANNLRLHMPGHIGGQAMPVEWGGLACLDLTEVAGMDDLHLPQGIIEKSRRLLAQAAGARESFFLVNGASCGVQAMLMSMAGDGEQIIIPRNAHRSFYAGMVLSGAWPVYLPGEIHAELGEILSVSCAEVQKALAQNPASQALFITSPSYYGTCSDISTIVQVAADYGKQVLVDEAHGGHFPFHSGYPPTALSQGAVAAVNGLHKTWPVLNPGAALHIGRGFFERERLYQAVSLLTTTSPSYPLLASIETARLFMEEQGYEYLEKARSLAVEYRIKINRIKGVHCYGEELIDNRNIIGLDPLKIIISTRQLSLSGYQLSRILREKYRIQLELESQHMVVAMFSLLHQREDWERLYIALEEIASVYAGNGKKLSRHETLPGTKTILSPRQAFLAAKEDVSLEDSLGRIAGEMIAVYPPGIPCLVPGELISPEILEYLQYLKNSPVRIQGVQDARLEKIKVVTQV
ncbi:Pyridoxal phosphate-dependent transferase [Syntrophomonas zehnderi OL-4]|uniref:Pyridoxal phosphate-dependent transferase n=2 Tax=Syntrophomonas TaxID=862 RepID=A0A0E4C9H7_9FIRM|nr:Pyridoxal phosphate-dependent transferase [Syntrophomonas zehnderi OL-4]